MAMNDADRARTYLEDFVAQTPAPVRHLARYIATQLQDALETVAGDPDALWRSATLIDGVATDTATLATEQAADRAAAGAADWAGVTAESFTLMMGDTDAWAQELSTGLGGIGAVLVAAQKASADAVNLLLELMFDIIAAFLAEAIAAAAAGLLSAGLSLAAFVVRWTARFAVAVRKIARITSTLAKVLRALARRLEELASWMAKHRQRIAALKAGRTSGLGQWLFKKTEIAAEQLLPLGVVNWLSPVNVPGTVGAATDFFAGGVDLIYDGRKDRNYVLDGTFREDIKKLPKELQDLIDSISF